MKKSVLKPWVETTLVVLGTAAVIGLAIFLVYIANEEDKKSYEDMKIECKLNNQEVVKTRNNQGELWYMCR